MNNNEIINDKLKYVLDNLDENRIFPIEYNNNDYLILRKTLFEELSVDVKEAEEGCILDARNWLEQGKKVTRVDWYELETDKDECWYFQLNKDGVLIFHTQGESVSYQGEFSYEDINSTWMIYEK